MLVLMISADSDQPLSAALEATVSRFAGMVRQVGWRHRLSDADVDEVIQEVRLRLWRSRGSSEQIATANASYVYRTAMSAAVDLLRRRRSRRADATVSLDSQSDLVAECPAGPDTDLAASELNQQVAQAIETIPPTRRAVVRMHLAGYPREEIADLLGWSEAKTRNLLYRGLADLRARLAERGIGLDRMEARA
jgi:RNA polymerase sigma-70 factor (ECF subfamily)